MTRKELWSPKASAVAGDAFARAVAIVLSDVIEGGLVDHPKDPGGLTNHGVSLRFALSAGTSTGTAGSISISTTMAMSIPTTRRRWPT